MGLGGCGDDYPTPPETWQEHWFEHVQNVERVYLDEHVAIYFDSDMDEAEAGWLYQFISDVWAYSKQTYGCMGTDMLYAIFHKNKYSGGHPSYYYDSSHDNRNMTDQGGGSWAAGSYDVASHEIAHVVESTASHTKYGSPAFGLWGDSKWAEFYQYDLYVNLNLPSEAERVYNKFINTSDSYPQAGTYWFRDWFYPLWKDYGGAQVMVNFYGLLEGHYGNPGGHMSGMNFGEYVHFMSGAANKNLKPMATTAFGWPGERESQFVAAQAEFSGITYPD
jgi:hypothetical protein